MLANILENIDTGTLIGLTACLGLYVIALQLWAIADVIGQAMRWWVVWWQEQNRRERGENPDPA